TAEAAAAVARIDTLAAEPFGATPFYHPPRGSKPTTVDTPDPTPDVDYVPDFKIKMIMATGGGNIALIDGARYRVGEELGNSGWMITEINSFKRSVSIEHEATGRVRTRYVD
ncbi:MAG: hypothetical protein HKO59_13775, partial [Phycisphaerales bacterium]|nr:hypothetical protein [Phycisphaerales bacterium]